VIESKMNILNQIKLFYESCNTLFLYRLGPFAKNLCDTKMAFEIAMIEAIITSLYHLALWQNSKKGLFWVAKLLPTRQEKCSYFPIFQCLPMSLPVSLYPRPFCTDFIFLSLSEAVKFSPFHTWAKIMCKRTLYSYWLIVS